MEISLCQQWLFANPHIGNFVFTEGFYWVFRVRGKKDQWSIYASKSLTAGSSFPGTPPTPELNKQWNVDWGTLVPLLPTIKQLKKANMWSMSWWNCLSDWEITIHVESQEMKVP